MKAFKIVGAVVVFVVLLILLLGNILPRDYRVERSTEIAAPPGVVFGEVNSFRNWDAWSPWLARDPSIQPTYSGPERGVGASQSWTSEDSGSGSQRIVESVEPSRIKTELDFGGQGTAAAQWVFEESGDGTRVTWSMQGEIDGPVGGLIATQMERFVGPDYEDGLSRLKQHVESLPPAAPEVEPEARAAPDAGALEAVDGSVP